jgi:DNA-binding transcriptional ArsR family regulator
MSNETQDDRVFKALAHARRRQLLDCLRDGPVTTGGLCDRFADMDRCSVMQHLKVLEGAGLVVARREGRERWNHLNALPIKHIHDRWISEYAGQALSLIDRLKSDLESQD